MPAVHTSTDQAPPHFAAQLASDAFVLTAEIIPPVSCDPADLLAKAEPLRGLVDAVNVTDAAGARVAMGALAAAGLLASAGFEPILQFTCRDRNRIGLQGDLLGAAALGVRNLLLLHGDQPSAGDQPDAKPVFDLDSGSLIATARRLADAGELPTGRKVGGSAAFCIGAADLPIDPPNGWKPDGLRRKIAAGAQFAQTQFCMDADLLRRYVARLSDEGILPALKLLVGVTPLRSARSARWMRQHLFGTVIPESFDAHLERAADPAAEGRRLCAELIGELATIPGIAGAHLMAPSNEDALPSLLEGLRLSPLRRA